MQNGGIFEKALDRSGQSVLTLLSIFLNIYFLISVFFFLKCNLHWGRLSRMWQCSWWQSRRTASQMSFLGFFRKWKGSLINKLLIPQREYLKKYFFFYNFWLAVFFNYWIILLSLPNQVHDHIIDYTSSRHSEWHYCFVRHRQAIENRHNNLSRNIDIL